MAGAATVQLLYRIDIGFDPEGGYAAAVLALGGDGKNRARGIKANSIQQLTSRLRNVLNEDLEKRRHFPLEHEREPSRIILP